MSVQPVPEGYHTVTPYYVVPDVHAFIEFIVKAFDAKEYYKSVKPDGRIGHADFIIGDSHVMAGEAPADHERLPLMVYMYVNDCDALYRQALAAGAESMNEPATQFYGDRHCSVKDPFGNQWWLATHVEDVSDEELERRVNQQYK